MKKNYRRCRCGFPAEFGRFCGRGGCTSTRKRPNWRSAARAAGNRWLRRHPQLTEGRALALDAFQDGFTAGIDAHRRHNAKEQK